MSLARQLEEAVSEPLQERIIGGGKWDGKFVGRNARLLWDDSLWRVDEMPQKGQRKVRFATMQNPHHIIGAHAGLGLYIPANVIAFARLSASDNYETIKRKVADGMKKDFERIKVGSGAGAEYVKKNERWLADYSWREEQINSLHVVPDDAEPMTIKGKDFVLKSSWREFSTASPRSDFQAADPHYTMYVQKNPTSARKLYLLLKSNPSVLSSKSWDELGKWFDRNKIAYKHQGSVWH